MQTCMRSEAARKALSRAKPMLPSSQRKHAQIVSDLTDKPSPRRKKKKLFDANSIHSRAQNQQKGPSTLTDLNRKQSKKSSIACLW